MGEKLYEATPSRLERARREGDVARSQDICAVVAFAGGLIATILTVPFLAASFEASLRAAFDGSSASLLLRTVAIALIPAASGAAAASVAGLWQAGGLHVVPIALRFERINPIENLRRMFSRETLVTVARATAAFCCAGVAVIPVARGIASESMQSGDRAALIVSAWSGALHAASATCAVAVLFALADYALQVARRRNRLRMSAEEFKRDRKEHEGDPLAHSRRRALHRQFVRGSLRRIKEASFVVVNPTHVAVALQYKPPDVPVPKVLIRAADALALRVRELAVQAQVPIVENVDLARALYAQAQAGDFIPRTLYVAIAEIVSALQQAL